MNIFRTIKNTFYDECEVWVREATSNDQWNAASTTINKIIEAMSNDEQYNKIFIILWKRITDQQHFRHVYKGLILLGYMVRSGSTKIMYDIMDNIQDIKKLEQYTYYDDSGHEIGKNIRKRAKKIIETVTKFMEKKKKKKILDKMNELNESNHSNDSNE